ncbi:MAG TPA: LD-carboxypeptidase [Jiangellaceae bacterium]|nr:LD-carboxypeptidase [Jiangellaceae bacterium]
MASILRPKALRPGDLVAVMALSGGLEQSEASLFARGVEAIEQTGFAVRVSPMVDLERRWWWAAAPPREVAEDFNGLLRDPQVRAIFSLTGGRMTLSYLDLIDLAAVRADPKPLLGFSDISTLHLVLHARTGWCPCTRTLLRMDSVTGTSVTTAARSSRISTSAY